MMITQAEAEAGVGLEVEPQSFMLSTGWALIVMAAAIVTFFNVCVVQRSRYV